MIQSYEVIIKESTTGAGGKLKLYLTFDLDSQSVSNKTSLLTNFNLKIQLKGTGHHIGPWSGSGSTLTLIDTLGDIVGKIIYDGSIPYIGEGIYTIKKNIFPNGVTINHTNVVDSGMGFVIFQGKWNVNSQWGGMEYPTFPNKNTSGTETGTKVVLPSIQVSGFTKYNASFTSSQRPTFNFLLPKDATKATFFCETPSGGSSIISQDVTGATSYTITDEDINKLLGRMPNTDRMECQFNLGFYLGSKWTVIEGGIGVFSKDKTPPTFTYTIRSNTSSLTGSENIYILNHPTGGVQVTFLAQSAVGNNITSYFVENGGLKRTGLSNIVTFNNLKDNQLKLSVADEKNITSLITKTTLPEVINYFPPEVKVVLGGWNLSSADNSAVSIPVTVSGKVFKGNFGKTENSLTIVVKAKDKNNVDKATQTITPTLTSENYSETVVLNNLSGAKDGYTFEVTVTDAITSVTTSGSAKMEPIFDYSSSNFRFNVPLLFPHGGRQGIYGTDSDGNFKLALEPCNDGGNLVIGYDNYSTDIGLTNIYGSRINLYSKHGAGTSGIQRVLNSSRQTDSSTDTWMSFSDTEYGIYMHAGQKYRLKEYDRLNQQFNGYILVWKKYSSSSGNNYSDDDINYSYIPKTVDTNKLITVQLAAPGSEKTIWGAKTIKITNETQKINNTDVPVTVISGHSSNTADDNKHWVLTKVIGW